MTVDTKDTINVLFVDDEKDFLELAEIFFEKQQDNIDLTVTTSAKEAVEILEEGDFDAVVSDYLMPGMTGLDLLENLRSKGDDIPFVILTGKGKEEVAMEALNKGADRYHIKSRDSKKQFKDIVSSIVEEVVRKKSENELKTFQTWIKNTLREKSEKT